MQDSQKNTTDDLFDLIMSDNNSQESSSDLNTNTSEITFQSINSQQPKVENFDYNDALESLFEDGDIVQAQPKIEERQSEQPLPTPPTPMIEKPIDTPQVHHDFSNVRELSDDNFFDKMYEKVSPVNSRQEIPLPQVKIDKPEIASTPFAEQSNILDTVTTEINAQAKPLSVQQEQQAKAAFNKDSQIDLVKLSKEQATEAVSTLMNTGRKSEIHSYARFKKKKKTRSFFDLEHSTEFVDPDNVTYDKYYEDILPLDAEEVKAKDLAKAKAKKIGFTIGGIVIGIVVILAIII